MLKKEGFSVYLNEAYPAGDGCIPLGQAYAARLFYKKQQAKE